MQFEFEVARRLAEIDCPVGELEPRVEPRVYRRDAFAITLWTYYEPGASRGREHVDISVSIEAFKGSHIAPADYAHALIRLHAGLRQIDLDAPHIADRIDDNLPAVRDEQVTPELLAPDRELLSDVLGRMRNRMRATGTGEQLLHGEPHPGNVLSTRRGPLFIDLGTCCRGPIEYDLAYAPEEVAEHYPEANQALIHECRILMWALITTYRWHPHDQLPNRDYWRIEGLNQIRAGLDRYGLG